MREFPDLFKGLGCFENEYKIELKEDAKPVAHAPRRVPLAIKDKLKNKLDELVLNGIIEKTNEFSEWVSHLVAIEKRDKEKSLRLCIDPIDLNKNILDDQSYIPTFDEFAAKLNGMKYFSVLDLKDGFWHVKLANESRNLCTFATPFGNYRYIRMPFGIKTGPKVFMRMNYRNFGDIENVLIYFDDILIIGKDRKEHDDALRKVLKRAREKNVRFNVNKIQVGCKEVRYLGHIFSLNQIKPDPERLEAIKQMGKPKNKKDLQTFLGVVNFLRPFIANLSEKTAALRELLKKNVIFSWTELHTRVIEEIKKEILKSNILVPFNQNKEIVVQCDASQRGLGCCLIQEGKPISFASRSLTIAEQNYAQIEKEMLAILFACNKFNFYTYGRTVRVVNDHKPLLGIMKKELHRIASSKLQRMRVKMLNYDILLEYAPGKTIVLADYLSRYMIESDENVEDKSMTESVLSINVSDERKQELQKETDDDPILKEIKSYCKIGWPNHKSKCPPEQRYFHRLKDDIFIEDDLLFYNNRLIIPNKMRKAILEKLHEPHFGVTKTQQRARNSVYWPNINNEIEQVVISCKICQENAPMNQKEPMISHEIPKGAFVKVACDILEFKGKNYLAVIDYYSKWLELVELKGKESHIVILELVKIFASHGFPRTLIADNNPFGSFECKEFAKREDINIITSSPNYPQSNGMAERAVQICKNILRKCKTKEEICKALLAYRTTPVKGMCYSPAQLLQNRVLRTNIPTHINKFKPEICIGVDTQHENKQRNSKMHYDRAAKQRTPFNIDTEILFRNNNKWQRGKIVAFSKTPRSYVIQSDERNFRRNSRHIREYFAQPNNEDHVNADAQPPNSHHKCTRSGRKY